MKLLLAFFCVVAVVAADPYCGQPIPLPGPVCLPEVIPVPVHPPVIGLLSQVINLLIAQAAEVVTEITNLIVKNNNDLIAFIHSTGGPGFNDCKKLNFFIRQSTEFWQAVSDILKDHSWEVDQAFAAAILEIEQQFSLVIDQPQVRSWLRELRDIPRIIKNLSGQAVLNRRAQWLYLAQQYEIELKNIIQAGLCSCPDSMQERFYRVINIGLVEAESVLASLKLDIDAIARDLVDRALELANYIYEVEILALKYFVS